MPYNITYPHLYPNCHESNWSLLNKVLLFNNVRYEEVKELFIQKRMRNFASYSYKESCVNFKTLRKNIGFHGNSFKDSNLNSKLKTLERLTVETLNKDENILYYCSECIKFGFHTPYFMTPYFSHCPIHRVKLSHSCPYCSKSIPHIISSAFLLNPYSCPNCGYILIDYELSKKILDIGLLDSHISNINRSYKTLNSWGWSFNFSRTLNNNFNDYSSVILNQVENIKFKYEGLELLVWDFIDFEEINDACWSELEEPWELQRNICHSTLIDCLFNKLINCFYDYQETSFFIDNVNEMGIKGNEIKKVWQRVWEQRVSHFPSFGRMKMIVYYISNRVAKEGLTKVNGILLMRRFEIVLVSSLFMQLHLSFDFALRSNLFGFDLRCDIERVIDNNHFFYKKINNKYKFFVVCPEKIIVDIDLIKLMNSYSNKVIKKSEIFKFCEKP